MVDIIDEEIGLNPLSIGSVFPTTGYLRIESEIVVLIPFLSGLFFQLETMLIKYALMCLNPLSIGSVFPTTMYAKNPWTGGLNPLSIGSVFPTWEDCSMIEYLRLNPLSIGSVFPTGRTMMMVRYAVS